MISPEREYFDDLTRARALQDQRRARILGATCVVLAVVAGWSRPLDGLPYALLAVTNGLLGVLARKARGAMYEPLRWAVIMVTVVVTVTNRASWLDAPLSPWIVIAVGLAGFIGIQHVDALERRLEEKR